MKILKGDLKELAAWRSIFGNMLVYSSKYDKEMKAKEVIAYILEDKDYIFVLDEERKDPHHDRP